MKAEWFFRNSRDFARTVSRGQERPGLPDMAWMSKASLRAIQAEPHGKFPRWPILKSTAGSLTCRLIKLYPHFIGKSFKNL